MKKEAGIHFELYRHLQNAIDTRKEYHGVVFGRAEPEKTVGSGRADIVVLDDREQAVLVIEAKKRDSEGVSRNIDPYGLPVIEQAFDYATRLGAEYFATYNGEVLVLFQTFEKGVPLLHRKSRTYRIKDVKVFASELLEQIAAIKCGKLGWEPDPRAFVNRLRVFHRRLAVEILRFVGNPSAEFTALFSKWAEKQGWDPKELGTEEKFSRQAAYLLMNRLLFYKLLEDMGRSVPRVQLQQLVDPKERRETFRKVTEAVDFEAVYTHDSVFDEIPLSKTATSEVGDFLRELESYELGRFQFDTIGHIYEDIIPDDERHDLGQYYTPPEIVELIVRMTIGSPGARVLDPACGSGSFLVRAYSHLKSLKQKHGLPDNHQAILEQLTGIDINRFPAHLSAINLALQDLKAVTKDLHLIVDDFFDVKPEQPTLFTETAGIRKSAGSKEFHVVPVVRMEVDVVVGNPPYIRQEMIADKTKCREHLKGIGYSDISERADIYVYFFTHGMEFLSPKGRMGLITSDKWLTTGYGEGLQRFLLDNAKVEAIVSFRHRVFEDPLVPTCVTILEKCSDEATRNQNLVKFLRVRNPMSMDQVTSILNEEREAGLLVDKTDYRLITLAQSELRTTTKWNRFLYAPTLYWEILAHDKMTRVKDVAVLTRGKTTGANDFFYLKTSEAKEWGIEESFLKPLVKSIRQVTSLDFRQNTTDVRILDLNDYIKKALADKDIHKAASSGLPEDTLPKTAKVKELSDDEVYVLTKMWHDGHQGLYRYIIHSMWEKDWGREGAPQRRSTCLQYRQRNRCWFDLGSLVTPDLFAAKGYWERAFFPLNTDRAVIDCRLYEIHTKESEVLAGILNSSLTRLMVEVHCRITGGGMSEIMVYELEELPILNPKSLTKAESEMIRGAFAGLVKSGLTQSEELDKAVLAPLNMSDEAKLVSEMAAALSEARRKGKESAVMIEGLGGVEKRLKGLVGAEVVSDAKQTKLSEY